MSQCGNLNLIGAVVELGKLRGFHWVNVVLGRLLG